jgi:hypothetical protein
MIKRPTFDDVIIAGDDHDEANSTYERCQGNWVRFVLVVVTGKAES